MNADHYAKEADRLLSDDVLKHAMDHVRAEALEALATVPADDQTMVLRFQAKVASIDEIRSELHAAILRGQGQDDRASYA